MPTSPRPPIGLIGLGIMGSAMSASLIQAGYEVIGYDVLAGRLRNHRKAGGQVAAGCRDVAKTADIIVCSLPSSEALLQTAAALLESTRPPKIVIETSTLPIAVKEKARRTFAARDTILLDCPLSGTGAQARRKDLVVYASGDRRAYRRVVPILEAFARAHYYVGAFGAGSNMKLVANLLVAIHNVAAAEALVLAMKAGLDPKMVLKAIGDGAGSSRMFQVRGPLMVKGRYLPAHMKSEIYQKDIGIIRSFVRRLKCPTPLFGSSIPIYATALRQGWAKQDTAAIHAVLRQRAGLRAKVPGRITRKRK